MTLEVNAARAPGTPALTSHDVPILMAAQRVVEEGDLAIMNYQIAALERTDMQDADAVKPLDEPGMRQFRVQLSKIIQTTLRVSLPPGSIPTADASP